MKYVFIIALVCISCSKQIPPCVEDKVPLRLRNPKQLHLDTFNFSIITQENFTSYIDKNAVYYCLDATNYKKASENLKQVVDYIKLQKRIIQEYKQYYEGDK